MLQNHNIQIRFIYDETFFLEIPDRKLIQQITLKELYRYEDLFPFLN
jgi:hypothetical protein